MGGSENRYVPQYSEAAPKDSRNDRRLSHLPVLLAMSQPALQQRTDVSGPVFEQGLGGIAD